MRRWQRINDGAVMSPTDLAQLVATGATIGMMSTDKGDKRGLTLQLPIELHEKLDEMVSRVKGLNKTLLCTFLLESGIYEFCKSIVENDPENSLFDSESSVNLDAEETIKEAFKILDQRRK